MSGKPRVANTRRTERGPHRACFLRDTGPAVKPHEIKAFEHQPVPETMGIYAMTQAGPPGVYSNLAPYQQAILCERFCFGLAERRTRLEDGRRQLTPQESCVCPYRPSLQARLSPGTTAQISFTKVSIRPSERRDVDLSTICCRWSMRSASTLSRVYRNRLRARAPGPVDGKPNDRDRSPADVWHVPPPDSEHRRLWHPPFDGGHRR